MRSRSSGVMTSPASASIAAARALAWSFHPGSAMTSQFDMFGGADDAPAAGPELPEGFRYQEELISRADETAVLRQIRELPFREFEFHGYTGKRRVVSF